MSLKHTLLYTLFFPARLLTFSFFFGVAFVCVSSLYMLNVGVGILSSMWLVASILHLSSAVLRAAKGNSYDFERLSRKLKVLMLSGPVLAVTSLFLTMGYILVSDAAEDAEALQKPPYVEPFYADSDISSAILEATVTDGPYPIEGTNTGLLRVEPANEPGKKVSVILGLPCEVRLGTPLKIHLIRYVYMDIGTWKRDTDQWSPILPPDFCGGTSTN